MRHLRNRRRLEGRGDFDVEMQAFMDFSEKMRGEKRIAAHCKEIIMDSDALDLKDVRVAFGESRLERCSRGDETFRPRRTRGKLGRQPDALHLSGRAFWQAVQQQHLARDL